MQNLEDIRVLLVKVGLVVAGIAYARMIMQAFRSSVLWGIFSLFCPPIGGWLHSFSTWWEMSRTFTLHAVALAVAGYALFFFPREPIYGYWTNASGDVVLNFQPDGTLRDYSIKSDGKFSFRGFKILTREIPVKSATRLLLSKGGEFHVAYFNPREGTLTLYHEMSDPEVFIRPPNSGILELRRVPDPNAADFQAKMEKLAVRENAYDTAVQFLAAIEKADPAGVPDETLLPRYERYLALARTGAVDELEKLPFTDQVHTLRLRALYAREIKSGAKAPAIIASDFKRDYFMLQPYAHAQVPDVSVDANRKKATAAAVVNMRQGIMRSLNLTATDKGAWNIALLETRDADIVQATKFATGKNTPLNKAVVYLERRLSIPENPEWLRPLGP